MDDPVDRIVAVVPAWQARERLAATLDALASQLAAIVVVDNGSTDGTADYVRDQRPTVTLIANADNRGYPAAVNQGIAASLGLGAEAVLVVNDDAVLAPGAVAALAQALAADPTAGAATARLLFADRPGVLNGAGGAIDWPRVRVGLRGAGEPDDGRYAAEAFADYPSGAAMLLRRAALEAVGDLDEAYFLYYEDADWGVRAVRAGWRTRYVHAAVAHHAGWSGTRDDPAKRRYYNVRNRLRFAQRYAPWYARLWVWLATLTLAARQPVRWFWPSRRADAEAVGRAILDHVRPPRPPS